jgi:hypothetical protein
MGKYLEETVGDGPLATFLGFWSVMGTSFFLLIPLLIAQPGEISERDVFICWHRTRKLAHQCNPIITLRLI